MSDVKLFHRQGGVLQELASSAAPLEKSLQTLFEKNLDALMGVGFFASEYKTSNGGRMDTLGLDENGYPVIIEYKRTMSENVINQGLFYLDWLMDHRADFKLLVLEKLGKQVADVIEWSAPRLIYIAADFTKYDIHAVNQMGRNVELIRYRRLGENLLLLDLLTSVSTEAAPVVTTASAPVSTSFGGAKPVKYKTILDSMSDASEDLRNLYADLEAFLLALGDDVTKKVLSYYLAFKRIKNFACVEIKPQLGVLRVFLKLDPTEFVLKHPDFTRDGRTVGHFGTGDLEVTIRSREDLDRATPLIQQSYEAS